jgi:uncharacterized protein YgbK (DUF1537 family)
VIRVGIVADDLTGAMDSAAPFADSGLVTRVLLAGDGSIAPAGAPTVVAVDTHSRDLSPAAAARAVRSAFAQIGQDCLPFKKIDSTLRGNIAAEIAAAMRASGCRCAVVAPSAPLHGRVVRDGRLLVNGQGTGAASLLETLRLGFPGTSVRPLRSGDSPTNDPCVLVADAETEDDLASIAAVCLAVPGKVLMVGSSGLATALARQVQPTQPMPVHPRYERLLFVVGSYNSRSAAQARALLADSQVHGLALTARGELRRTAKGQSDARAVILHVDGLDAAPAMDAQSVAQRLAGATAELLAEQGAGSTALFLTGGDTARATLSHLRVDAVDVIGNLYPGVVHGRASVAGQTLGVITKAGGFGDTDLFVRAVEVLVRSEK